MDPFSALIGVGGSLLTGLFNSSNVDRTNEFNAQQAQLNRDFQERMSSTAYQRGMADMRAAGLNPILAYQRGGASTPSGSSASGTPATMPDLGQAAHSAMSASRMKQEINNLKETNELTKLQQDVARETAQRERNTAKSIQQDITINAPKEEIAKEQKTQLDDMPTMRGAAALSANTRDTTEHVKGMIPSWLQGLVGSRGSASSGAGIEPRRLRR